MMTQNDNFETVKLEDNGELFIAVVFDFRADRIKRILMCKDYTNPENEEEANDVYLACMYVGVPIHGNVMDALGGFPPNNPPHRHLYCLTPWSERRGTLKNFAGDYDEGRQVTPGEGSLSYDGDHEAIRSVSRMGVASP